MLSGAVLALVTANPAMGQAADALPTGGTVVAGSATIGTPSSAKLDIVQSSNRAVIEWTGFDIGQNAEVAFAQPNATAIALNRVTGGTAPSQIAGKLTANGMVAVLNANGVLFAGTADVDVGGLIVSTGQIDTTAFMAGGNVLGVTGANGGEIVVSAGADITVANAGLAALVAPSVRNSGTITATAGRVQLGAGTAFTLDLASDGLLQIGVGADSPLVQNHGSLFATGGQIQLSARQASALLDQTIRTGVLPVGTARLDGSTIVLDATGSNVEIASEIAGRGNLVLSGSRIFGAADVNVDGNLTLNVNAGGAVADTIAGGNNWINDALGVIGAQVDTATINLGAGLYRPGTVINASNVTLDGQGVARIGWVGGIENAIDVWGDNVAVRNLEIFGPATSAYTSFAWGSTNSRGVFVNRFADNVTVTNNNIHDIRTGIIVDGRNVNALVTGNRLDNTKSGISVQYTNGGDALTSGLAGSSITLAGNFEGAIGNEWGINVHLNGIWDGGAGNPGPSTSPVGGLPVGILGTASLAEQQRLVALGAANNGMAVQNIAYSGANRTRAYVAPSGGTVTQGSRLSPLASVQAGVNAVVTGGTVFVLPGEYSEGVTGVGQFGGSGGNNFGLHVTKDGLTIRGVDQNWQPITSAENVAAYVKSLYQSPFGAQHFIAGSNVTIEGLGFRPATAGNNKTLEVVGNNFTLRNSVIDNTGNATAANFYISDFEQPGTPRVESFTLTGNIFRGGTVASAMVVVGGGVGRTTGAANRVFANNQLFGTNLAGRRGFQIQGRIPSTAWQQLLSGPATLTGNVFTGVDIPVRTTGILTAPLAWDDIFRNNGNVFTGGAVIAYKGNTGEARGVLVVDGSESYEDVRITRTIQASIDRTSTGDTVRMLNGTYNLGNSPILIRRGLSLIGASQAGVIIDGRGVGAGLGTMQVQADNVTLSNFTLYGADSGSNNYGIKVQPNSSGGAYSPNQRLLNFAISNVTVRGSTRAELDLNGVVGATITNFTADGRRVTNDAFQSAGAGVQITDSSNVALTGVHTLGNAWGSVALYQANKSNAYNGQTTNITIDAAANQFDEPIGLFSQLESTTQGFGQLNLTGFNYAVRNTDHRADDLDAQFIFYRTSLIDAVAFAKAVGTASASSIEGYTGAAFSNVFTVADGLTIGSALRDVRAGGTVNVGAGTFAETVSIDKALTFTGAGMDATSITGGMLLSGSLNDLVLRDFTVSGSGGSSVIGSGGTITGLTVDGVRIDGLNVANRHGFSGGQIAGDISITDSEFLNIRGWAAFDTRSGAGGSAGSQIASGVFANNLIDNTVGHIAFRNQTGAANVPDIIISGNTVRNVGSATNSFGAVFKAFNADTVDFTGNNVSGVGTSGFSPTGEAAYGAVLMTRGTAVLNVTGNTFTNNNQVFAVEPDRGLPGVTNFSNNSFINNGYSIYLPAHLDGAGTIQFGAGNDFTAGADTVQHILWRSASGLDLTGVSFDGTLPSELSLDEAFAVEDLITHGVDLAGFGLVSLIDGELFVTTGSGTDAALRAVALGTDGDTLNLSAGTHTLTDTLFLTHDIDLAGQGIGTTILDASGHNSYGIRVHADDVALSGFTLNGSAAAGNSTYGVKVESGGGANERNTDFAISNVAIAGSRQTGLDLEAATGALIDGVSVTGSIAGSGISIADSANVVVRNSSTSGNALGGLALRQSNGNGHQQLDQVTIEANNAFSEANGVSLQAASAIGAVSVLGYGYTVRNGDQFTYFQKTAQNAFDYAVNLAPSTSAVQGWTGSADDHNFHVGHGTLTSGGQQSLSLQAAFGASATGDTINVASGAYAENATLSGTRTLNFGDVVLNGLALAATTAGNSLKGNLTLASGNFAAAGPLTLTGGTAITATSGNISLGAVTGAHALTLNGPGITLGAANLASLTATGTSITTGGVTTTGAQSYAGLLTLNGSYGASTFAVNGATMLGGTTAIATTGSLSLGTVTGPQALTLNGNAVTLGAANIASLAATGGSISTAGAITTGAQSYTGPVTLSGSYGASDFTVIGAATLGGATAIAASGNVGLGTIGGAQALSVSGTGITLGAASLASLAATGTSIVTSGATTTGAQSYAGPVTLNGSYGAASFAATGAVILGGSTTIAASGTVGLGSVTGAQGLTVSGAAVTLGAASLASLTATGTSITTSGVTTTGSQNYAGPVTLSGSYNASSFNVTGATTLGGATTIAAAGDISLAAVTGAQALNLSGNTVTLGAASLASLAATGTSVATSGATTTGAQSYTGPVTLAGSYGASSFTVTGATTLGASTTIATSGDIGLGTVGGPQGLTLSGAGITLGTASLANLVATGTSIATSGVTTTGAQSYTGPVTLNGNYGASSFTASGATTLGGAATIAASGTVGLGTVSGGQALALSGNSISLGAANVASLAATGASIATSGVTTTGAQNYAGAITLSGGYGASSFAVTGATTLGGATTIAATGTIALGTISGEQALTLSGSGITLGTADLGSLSAAGTTIATEGVLSTGAQTYVGATALSGIYNAASLSVGGATTLAGDTSIAAADGIALGGISGGRALTLSGEDVTLGTASLAALTVTAAAIITDGVSTTGAQSYTGPVTVSGGYSASSFTASGATTLAGATTIAVAGALGLGTVGGAEALALSGGAVTLGAADVASLVATGESITTTGVTTTGVQSYVGAVSLDGTYGAGGFTVDGVTTLAGDTSVSAIGDIALDAVEGGHALTLSGEDVTLGSANLAALSATGANIATSGVTTTGAQSYAGATILAGDYAAADFSVNGAVTLAADTLVTTGGAATFGSIDGAENFALAADSIALGAVGQDIRLAALTISADETVLTAGTYRADSLSFAGEEGATVRLTHVETIFDSTPAGGSIEIVPHLIGTEPGQQNVAFVTGTGAASDGDIALGNVGTNAVRIGDLSVTGGDFSAATVKLAGDFTSLLGGSQVFSAQTLDTLGNVKAQVAGSESGPIVAGGSVNVVAGGSGTGSIVAGGPVELAYSNEVSRAISSQSSVSLAATGPVTGSITATGSVAVNAAGPVSATVKTDNSATIASVAGVSSNVTAGGGVQLTATQGTVSSEVSSGGTVQVNATGAVTGSITATGPVAVNADGLISTTVKTDNSATIASIAGVSSSVTAGGGVQLTASQGDVNSQVSSGGTVNVNANGAVTGSIAATGPVAVAASGPVSTAVNTGNSVNITSATGVSSAVTAGGAVQVSATQGGVSGSISSGGAVNVTAAGPVSTAVNTTGAATIASGSGVSSTVTAGGGVNVSATQGPVTGSINAGGAVAVTAQGPVTAAVTTTGAANVVSTLGGVSSTIDAGGPVAVTAPGAVTSTITSGSTVQLTSNTPIDVQVTGGAVSVNAPGGQVSGVFGEITTDDGGTFVVNDQPVVGNGIGDARQIIIDSFLAPVGGTVGAAGEPQLPNGLTLALIAPSGAAAGQRAVVVGSVDSLGDLLRRGYTAIIIDVGESGLELEPEDAGS